MRSWLHRGHAAFLTLCAVLIGVLAASAVIARPDTRKASGPAPAAQPEQRGGALVLIEGTILDLDGDGLQEIVDRDVRFDGASPAYSRISLRSSASGVELASIVGPELNDMFGWAVAAFPDVNGDGVCEMAVAAPRANAGINTRGRVHNLCGDTGDVLLDCVQSQEAGFIGLALLPVEDVDLDGDPDLLIAGARPTGQTWAAGPNLERPRGETDPLRIAEGGFRTCFGTPAFAGSGGYNEHVLHVLDSDGVPGQGGVANPLSYFCNHQVVYLNGRYYDPSYGVSFANLAELRDAQVLGLGMRVCSSEDLHPACLTSCDGVNIGDAEQYNFGGLGNNDFLQLSTTFPMVAAVGCTIDAPLPQRPQTVNIAD